MFVYEFYSIPRRKIKSHKQAQQHCFLTDYSLENQGTKKAKIKFPAFFVS